MLDDSISRTQDGLSPGRFRLSLKELLLLITALCVVLGTPILVGRLCGFSPARSLIVSFLHTSTGIQIPVLLVWLVGGMLILRRWNAGRNVSGYALIAIGGLLAISVARSVFYLWLRGAYRGPYGMAFFWAAAIVPPILMAVCWAMLIAALLGWEYQPGEKALQSTTSEKGNQKYLPFGLLVLCTLSGAGLGFCLNILSDQLTDSPYKTITYVVGGCLFGLMIGLAVDVVAARSRR